MRYQHFKFWTLMAIVLMVSAFLTACGGGGGGGGGGSAVTAEVTLSVSSDTVPANGVSSVTITITVTDSDGEPAETDTRISCETTLGEFINGRQTYTIRTPDDTGEVLVALITGTVSGTADITVKAEGVTQQISVDFTFVDNAGRPVAEEFGLAPLFHNISGLRIFGLEDVITAAVGDVFGNSVEDDTIIEFKTYNTGGLLEPSQDRTVDGFAQSTLFSTNAPIPLHGFLSVTGETEGASTLAISSLAVTPPPSNHIMYATTTGAGIFKSTNSGASWTNISRSSLNARFGQNWVDPYTKGQSDICIDPDDPNTIYVGTGFLGKGNVYRSRDGGLNWNSNNTEEWNGILRVQENYGVLVQPNTAVLTVLCDDNMSDYVWIGTEGRGPLFATDGETFQPSGGSVTMPAPGIGNAGTGVMTEPILSYSSQTETWTTTAIVPNNATVTLPVLEAGGDPAANGWMSNVATSLTTLTELWTTTYMIASGAVNFFGTGTGNLGNIDAKAADSETWTIRCIVDSFDDICDGGAPPACCAVDPAPPCGEETVDAGKEIFSVRGTRTGALPNVVVEQSYDEDVIAFQINPGATPFREGDFFRFVTSPSWRVTGSVSGVQASTARNGDPYVSDGNEVAFTINQGSVPFAEGDTFTFNTVAPSPSYWRVAGSVSGLQSRIAQTGFPYRSDSFEVGFTIIPGLVPFAEGDTFTFNVNANTVNHAWNVRDLVKVAGTNADTAILYAATDVGVYKTTNGARIWDLTGRFTGDSISALALHPISTGGGNDVIYAGTQNAGVWVSYRSGAAGTWQQLSAGMENGQGAMIKDLLVDPLNNRLYAVTYSGSIEAPESMIYVHRLNANGRLASASWAEAGTNLPGNAVYVLAADDPANPSALYAGGDINFFKAVSGLATGDPVWQPSISGLSNIIMTRLPILFTDFCTMFIDLIRYENNLFFTVYIQDANGNPPIAGSSFTVEAGDTTLLELDYPDTYEHQGTFPDPSDPRTDNPYTFLVPIDCEEDDYEVTFTFEPTSNEEVPGDSGLEQERIFTFNCQ